jgi:hypothetical protein
VKFGELVIGHWSLVVGHTLPTSRRRMTKDK